MSDPSTTPPRHFSFLGLGVIAALVLALIGIVCVGLLGAPPSTTPFGPVGADAGPAGPFNQVANDFLLELKNGQVDAAYGRTSKEYQRQQPLERFRALLQRHPFPGVPGSVMSTQKEDAPRGVYVYKYEATGPGGRLTMSFEVGKEGEHYKVTSLTLN